MGGVLRYKLEVYCQYFSDKLQGLGVPEQGPGQVLWAVVSEPWLEIPAELRLR